MPLDGGRIFLLLSRFESTVPIRTLTQLPHYLIPAHVVLFLASPTPKAFLTDPSMLASRKRIVKPHSGSRRPLFQPNCGANATFWPDCGRHAPPHFRATFVPSGWWCESAEWKPCCRQAQCNHDQTPLFVVPSAAASGGVHDRGFFVHRAGERPGASRAPPPKMQALGRSHFVSVRLHLVTGALHWAPSFELVTKSARVAHRHAGESWHPMRRFSYVGGFNRELRKTKRLYWMPAFAFAGRTEGE